MYIYKTKSNKYCIRKRIKNGEKEYYGTYPTLHEAQQKLETLIQQGKIKPKYLDPMRYITMRHRSQKDMRKGIKKYRVRKVINGKEFDRTFTSLGEAMAFRDTMESINWGMPFSQKKAIDHTRYTGIKYIRLLPNGKYALQRKNVQYGVYPTVIDAVKDKLFWESIDWDMDNLDNY